jgi:hypothetical protein
MNKYHAKITHVDGIKFHSKGEANRYRELKLLERAKVISELELQPAFSLACGGTPIKYASGRQAKYIADFRYKENGETVVEDFKGADTDISKLKRAIVKAQYGVDVKLIRGR